MLYVLIHDGITCVRNFTDMFGLYGPKEKGEGVGGHAEVKRDKDHGVSLAVHGEADEDTYLFIDKQLALFLKAYVQEGEFPAARHAAVVETSGSPSYIGPATIIANEGETTMVLIEMNAASEGSSR